MTKFQKLVIGLLAGAVAIAAVGSYSANGASWSASHVNTPGAPYSSSEVTTVTIYQRGDGVKITCNHSAHTNADATVGTTTVECLTYEMMEQMLEGTGTAACDPQVGIPFHDIAVTYQISANTPVEDNTYWSKGNINLIK